MKFYYIFTNCNLNLAKVNHILLKLYKHRILDNKNI